jgi:hypothetical protein
VLLTRWLAPLAARFARPQLVTDDALDEVHIYVAADGKIHVQFTGSGKPEDAAKAARMCFAAAQMMAAQAGLVVVAPAPTGAAAENGVKVPA